MQEFPIGEVLRKRRLELGLTQAEVCEGICEPSTLSRIENKEQTPCRSKLIALLQRLGLPEDRYYALVDKNESQISELQAQITFCNIHRSSEDGLHKIVELENLASSNDLLTKQFILRSKVALGKCVDGHIVPYSFTERLDMLFSAMDLTCPNFNISDISHGLYSINEIKIINQIALTYSNAGQRNISLNIYSQLFEYVQNHVSPLNQTMVIILVAYNYSRDLCYEKRLEESIKMGNLALNASRRAFHLAYQGDLFYTLAYCFYQLGQQEISKKYFYTAYYIYSLTDNSENIELTQEAFRNLFHTEIGCQISSPPAGSPISCGAIPEPSSPES